MCVCVRARVRGLCAHAFFLESPQGPGDSLGISLAGGVGSPHDNAPLFIAAMDTNGLAAKTQQLQVGKCHVKCVCVCACVPKSHCWDSSAIYIQAILLLSKFKKSLS